MNDDTISRQAAIETVKKHYRVDNDLLEVIAYEIEALPSAQPGWIPCSERLPEDGRYLVSVRILHEYNKVMISRFDNGEFWDSDVVAWMPLPTPYREGGQDGKN